jgi:hypothetical protein
VISLYAFSEVRRGLDIFHLDATPADLTIDLRGFDADEAAAHATCRATAYPPEQTREYEEVDIKTAAGARVMKSFMGCAGGFESSTRRRRSCSFPVWLKNRTGDSV